MGMELGINLAISLHAANDELRNQLVPINKTYSIKDLLKAVRNYSEITNQKKITIEYVMLKGVNDSIKDAKQLKSLLVGFPSLVNLIPFNNWPGSGLESSSEETIQEFKNFLDDSNFQVTIRRPRGREVHAACGQLQSIFTNSILQSQPPSSFL